MTPRRVRRMAGLLKARLPEIGLEQVEDPRAYARRWSMAQILGTVLLGLMAGCRSLAETEELSEALSVGVRRLLGLPRRLADTTMRDLLCRVPLDALRGSLHRIVRAAWRRKALESELPFHAVALDGKATAVPCFDNRGFVQRHVPELGLPYGLARTVTCSLITARGRPCIDAIPIPAETNEMGHFRTCLDSLVETYGKLFRVVTYDAGALSDENGAAVVQAGKDYLFRLRGEQRIMHKLANELLDPDDVVAQTVDVLDCKTTVTRKLVMLPIQRHWSYGNGKKAADSIWRHAHTFLRVHSVKEHDGVEVDGEVRIYVTSLSYRVLEPEQWLSLIRAHWGVENNNHHTLDAAFREDDRPWIEADPHGVLAVMLLRRIAYTVLTLFRSVTQRSDETRAMRWRSLLQWVRDVLVSAGPEHLSGLRTREVAILG